MTSICWFLNLSIAYLYLTLKEVSWVLNFLKFEMYLLRWKSKSVSLLVVYDSYLFLAFKNKVLKYLKFLLIDCRSSILISSPIYLIYSETKFLASSSFLSSSSLTAFLIETGICVLWTSILFYSVNLELLAVKGSWLEVKGLAILRLNSLVLTLFCRVLSSSLDKVRA